MLLKTATGWLQASGQPIDEKAVRVMRLNIFNGFQTLPNTKSDSLFAAVEKDRLKLTGKL